MLIWELDIILVYVNLSERTRVIDGFSSTKIQTLKSS